MRWLAIFPLVSALSIASQNPLGNTDECGLPTGADAPQCDEYGTIRPRVKPITSLLCNFTLSTTVENSTLQYGLTTFYKDKIGNTFIDSQFGAPATFYGLQDSGVNAYSPMIPEPELKIDTRDAEDAIYKLWLEISFSMNAVIVPVIRDPDIGFSWGKQSLYYDCDLYFDETFTPVLALELPYWISPRQKSFMTDVDAFVGGRDERKALQIQKKEIRW